MNPPPPGRLQPDVQSQTGWGQVLARFAEWIAPQPRWRSLDVGCGPGLLAALLAQAGCQAFGVDLDPTAFLPAPLHLAVARADVLHLPFPAQSFDLLTASNLLFLLADPPAALLELGRLLRPGGVLALLNPSPVMNLEAARTLANARRLQGLARTSLLDWAARAEAGSRWSEAELSQLLAAAGLRLVGSALRVGPGLALWARAVRPE